MLGFASGGPAAARAYRTEHQVLTCPPITIIPERYEAFVDGSPLELTVTEFKLLLHLIQSRGRVLSREQLLQKVWDHRAGGISRTVDTFIQRLRKKLGKHASQIQTIRCVGYKIEPFREQAPKQG